MVRVYLGKKSLKQISFRYDYDAKRRGTVFDIVSIEGDALFDDIPVGTESIEFGDGDEYPCTRVLYQPLNGAALFYHKVNIYDKAIGVNATVGDKSSGEISIRVFFYHKRYCRRGHVSAKKPLLELRSLQAHLCPGGVGKQRYARIYAR